MVQKFWLGVARTSNTTTPTSLTIGVFRKATSPSSSRLMKADPDSSYSALSLSMACISMGRRYEDRTHCQKGTLSLSSTLMPGVVNEEVVRHRLRCGSISQAQDHLILPVVLPHRRRVRLHDQTMSHRMILVRVDRMVVRSIAILLLTVWGIRPKCTSRLMPQ